MVVPPECGFALWLAPRYANLQSFEDKVYRDFANAVVRSKKFETWGVEDAVLLARIRRQQPQSYISMVNCVYRIYADKNNEDPIKVGDKNNYYINHLNEIGEYFPDSSFVFIIRDGRDVACSYRALADKKIESAYKPNLESDIVKIAEEWSCNAEKIHVYGGERSMYIKYETLIERPVEELSRVCQFLGLDYSPRMLEYRKRNDEPSEFLQWKGKTTEAPDPSNIGKFRQLLIRDELARFESVAGKMLRKFGYL